MLGGTRLPAGARSVRHLASADVLSHHGTSCLRGLPLWRDVLPTAPPLGTHVLGSPGAPGKGVSADQPQRRLGQTRPRRLALSRWKLSLAHSRPPGAQRHGPESNRIALRARTTAGA